MHPNFEVAVKAMVRKGKTFEPNPQSSKIYNDLYNDVYKKLYTVMEPVNRRIAQITGYPAED
jgi:sugar (pentulose or hexulose) kinase